MQLKSILNRVQKYKSFVYEEVVWGEGGEGASLRVSIRPRAHTRPVCSGCKRARPGYDTLPARDFEFVPLWGIAVFFVYALRRVNCKRCGVKVEAVPWATGKHTLTTAYMQFLALWARRLAWSEVARVFHTSWEKVFHSVEWMVQWGLEHRRLEVKLAELLRYNLKLSAPTCSRRTSSSSGTIARPFGQGSSWMVGVRGPCARASSP